MSRTPPTTRQPCTDPVYGPVWSYDDMSRSLSATQDAADPTLWHVTLSSNGVYHAFANPRIDNTAYHGSGVMTGWVTYDVHSSLCAEPGPTSR